MGSPQNFNVLVTGGAGFVGSHVVDRLLAAGHPVRVLARRTSDVGRLLMAGVEIVHGDLADTSSLREAVAGQEVLVNLATTMGGTARGGTWDHRRNRRAVSSRARGGSSTPGARQFDRGVTDRAGPGRNRAGRGASL